MVCVVVGIDQWMFVMCASGMVLLASDVTVLRILEGGMILAVCVEEITQRVLHAMELHMVVQ